MTISAMMLRSYRTRLPHCSARPHDLEECNRPTIFAAASRYSLITFDGISAELRATCPIAPLSATLPFLRMVRPYDPLICVRAFGGDPYTAHTTLAVVIHPLAARLSRMPSSNSATHPFCWLASQPTFSERADYYPCLDLLTTTRPCLRAPMGGAWQRLRLSLLWTDHQHR